MAKKDLKEQIAALLSIKEPAKIKGLDVVEDLSEFKTIYSDGQFSDAGVLILYNPKTNLLLRNDWSKWQGVGDEYDYIAVQEYIDKFIWGTDDPDHCRRAIEGLRKLTTLIEHLSEE